MQELKRCKAIFSTNQDKLEILKSLTENSVFLNARFIDGTTHLSEYSSNYQIFMKTYYQIPYDLANSLKSIFDYIDLEKNYQSYKLNHLKSIKKILIQNEIMTEFNYRVYDDNIIASVNSMPVTKRLNPKEIIPYMIENKADERIHLYESMNQIDTVYAVFEKVVALLNENTDIEDIVILNSTDNDDYVLEKLFFDANIPIQINKPIKINTYPQIIKLLKIIQEQGYQESKDYLLELIKDNDSIEVSKAVLRIYNSYFDEDLISNPDFLLYLINSKKIQPKQFSNCINVYDFDDFVYDANKHYLVMNYTDQSIPKSHTKTSYLSKEELKEIDYISDQETKDFWNVYYTNQLKVIRNLYLFFPKTSQEENRICKLNLAREVVKHEYQYHVKNQSYLNSLNKLEFAKSKFNFETYNLLHENYKKLYSSYNKEHQIYKHEFTGIRKNDLDTLLDKHNTLTGAKLETYQMCQFQFLMTYLLRIDSAEENISLYLGNLSHKILEEITKNSNVDYHQIIDQFDGFPETDKYKEPVFKKAIKYEMDKLVPLVKELHNNTKFTVIKPETKFKFEFKPNKRFNITGTIDKMMVYEAMDGKSYVAFIDYKLSSKDFKMDAFHKHQQFQLPVYLYAYKNINEDEIIPVGLYYQTTTLGRYYQEEGAVEKNYQLSGVSINDKSTLLKLDKELEHIRGISLTKAEELSDRKSGRLIEQKDFDEIYEQVEKSFIQMANDLEAGKFEINPISAYGSKKDSVSCEYCSFASICFNKNKKLEVDS